MNNFSLSGFQSVLEPITTMIGASNLDQELEAKLNLTFSKDSEIFKQIQSDCLAGISAGELCKYEAGGIKYSRVFKPSDDLNGFGVELVQMNDVKGPHHRHPKGEIDLIMPLSSNAKFDGQGAGWLVYGPDSAHYPTVSGGEALVLYLLPNGEIQFTATK